MIERTVSLWKLRTMSPYDVEEMLHRAGFDVRRPIKRVEDWKAAKVTYTQDLTSNDPV